MRNLLRLSVLLISVGVAAQAPHRPSIDGGVHNDHFNFTHASEWKDTHIVNQVHNDHSQALVVSGPKQASFDQ